MRLNNKIYLLAFSSLLTACSPTDFFLGEDNRPEAKPLPVVSSVAQSPIIWSTRLGNGNGENTLMLAPAGDASNVYAVSNDGEVAAYDINSGKARFTRSLGKNITAGITQNNGLLFIGTRNGEIMALDALNGETVWRSSLGGAILARPAVGNGMVIVRSNDGMVVALDERNGVQLWQYRISDPKLSLRGYAQPIIGGGVVIITTNGGRFIVLDQATGLPVTEQRLAVGQGYNDIQRLVDMDATPKINRDILFSSAYQSNTFAIDLRSGLPLWTQPQASTADDFAMSPDGLFLHNDIDHVFALNQKDGSIRWQSDILEGRGLSPMLAIPGRVGAIDSEGYLHWFDISDGTLVGQNKIGNSSAFGAPYVGQNTIVWQLADGDVVAIRP